MRATTYLLEAFRTEGISEVFLVPGGLIDPFLPAFSSTNGIKPIVAAHEGGAACMADGYARAGGRFGVCFAIGGPGVTNMMTAVAAASFVFDRKSIPREVQDKLTEQLGIEGVVELVTLVGFYLMIAGVIFAFDVPLPEGAEPPW